MGIIKSELGTQPKSVDENEVDRLDRELSEIDSDVVRYLKRPQETPPPNFERLIAQIQALPERKDYPKSLSLKITNLKYKAYYYDRSWRQIRENAVEAAKGKKEFERRKETYFCAPTVDTKEKIEKSGVKVTDMLYQVQQKKLVEHEAISEGGEIESRQAFNSRILKQYEKLQSDGKTNKKLVLAWNKEKKRCDLVIDKRLARND